MSFPFDSHSAAVCDSHLPCRAQAIPNRAGLLKATERHGRRGTACGLLARVRVLPATTRSTTKLLSDAYQSQMKVVSVKPNTVCMDEEKSGSSTLQKWRCYTVGQVVLIFPATMRTFTKDTALWGSRAGAQYGRGTARARHAMCESATNLTSQPMCAVFSVMYDRNFIRTLLNRIYIAYGFTSACLSYKQQQPCVPPTRAHAPSGACAPDGHLQWSYQMLY